jgi:hypothetical protein
MIDETRDEHEVVGITKSEPMRISELIAELERRKAKHGDIHVFVTWEGTVHSFNLREIYASIEMNDDGEGPDLEPDLLIDADGNSYKDDLALADETDREGHVRNYV